MTGTVELVGEIEVSSCCNRCSGSGGLREKQRAPHQMGFLHFSLRPDAKP